MFAALFYIVIGWIVLSFGVGVIKYLKEDYPSYKTAQTATVDMLLLPYNTVKMVYEMFKK